MSVPQPPAPLAAAPRIGDWIRIASDGHVTALSGRVELGQGASDALLRMTAAELGLSLDQVTLQTARTDQTPNEGYTAGSMSVSVGGMALRWAASALRRLVLEAAAERLSADLAELDVRGGAIVRDGVNTGLRLAALAPSLDLDQPVADLAAPRPPADRPAHPGDGGGRADLRARMVGAPFVHDLDAPDMLHGAPVHPPSMSATLVDLDVEALRARPGVVAVVRDGSFVGVVADSPWAASRAAHWARSRAVWQEAGPLLNDPMAAIAGSEAEPVTVLESGAPETSSGRVFQTTVSRPFLHHGAIGPSAAVARWTDDDVTVWTHSQGVFQVRQAIADVLRIDPERVTAVHMAGAGCYGHNGADDAAFDAVLMARAVPERIVKVQWSRQDEFQAAPMGPGMVTTAMAALDGANRMTSMEVTVTSPPHANRPGVSGAPNLRAAAYLAEPVVSPPSNDLPMTRGGGADRNATPCYAVPNVRVRKRLVHGLPYRSSSLRGLGAATNVFAIETLIDDIAADLGEDPVEFRCRHLDDARAVAVVRTVAEMAADAHQAPTDDVAGWGLGYARYKNTSGYCAVILRVVLDTEVHVTDAFCAADIGEVISPDGARNQIEGGLVQAISWATQERAGLSGAQVATEGWNDYPILRFSQTPRIDVRLIGPPDAPPLGCGEISQGPTVAAVGNAVRDATGARIRDLPIDRDAIVAALA